MIIKKRNLLTETMEAITRSGHKHEDIIFIGSQESGYSCTWDQFKILANTEYDSSYGWSEVATDLIIVFSDGSKMWRWEYDGSEGWEYSTPFVMPKETKEIKSLIIYKGQSGWMKLKEIHEGE